MRPLNLDDKMTLVTSAGSKPLASLSKVELTERLEVFTQYLSRIIGAVDESMNYYGYLAISSNSYSYPLECVCEPSPGLNAKMKTLLSPHNSYSASAVVWWVEQLNEYLGIKLELFSMKSYSCYVKGTLAEYELLLSKLKTGFFEKKGYSRPSPRIRGADKERTLEAPDTTPANPLCLFLINQDIMRLSGVPLGLGIAGETGDMVIGTSSAQLVLSAPLGNSMPGKVPLSSLFKFFRAQGAMEMDPDGFPKFTETLDLEVVKFLKEYSTSTLSVKFDKYHHSDSSLFKDQKSFKYRKNVDFGSMILRMACLARVFGIANLEQVFEETDLLFNTTDMPLTMSMHVKYAEQLDRYYKLMATAESGEGLERAPTLVRYVLFEIDSCAPLLTAGRISDLAKMADDLMEGKYQGLVQDSMEAITYMERMTVEAWQSIS